MKENISADEINITEHKIKLQFILENLRSHAMLYQSFGF
jgi:hypothetical protein